MNVSQILRHSGCLSRHFVIKSDRIILPRFLVNFHESARSRSYSRLTNYGILQSNSLFFPQVIQRYVSLNPNEKIVASSLKKENDFSNKKRRVFIPLLALALFSNKKEEEDEEEKESQLVTMIKLGILALRKGELDKAEQLLHIALKTAQEGQNEQAITYIFDLMANLAYQRGQYPKAETLFKDVLKRLFAGGMADNDNAVVEISLKLASVYASRGDSKNAVMGFHFCIGTQEEKIKKIGENNVDEDTLLLWAMSMDWYARFLLSIHQYELAKKHFIKAYEMSERIQGSKHPQTAVLLNDIGSVCSLQHNYAEAVTYLEKAIDAARESESPDLPSFYVNLGAVYLQQGILSKAERYCKEGYALAKRNKNEEALEEAGSCLKEIKSAREASKQKSEAEVKS